MPVPGTSGCPKYPNRIFGPKFRVLVIALKKIFPVWRIKLTEDTETEKDFGGYRIAILPVWKWLLQKNVFG